MPLGLQRTAICILSASAWLLIGKAAPQQVPTFRDRVDLIQLDVSVVDKGHLPVRGLAATDFTVLENGKPQVIQAFVPINLPEEAPTKVGWMRDVAPDVVANTNVEEDRLIVMVLDDFSEDMDKDLWAQKKIKEIGRGIIEHLGPRDLAAVVYTVASKNNQEFTHDRARLLEAVDKYNRGASIPGFAAPAVLPRICEILGSVPERRKVLIWISPGEIPPGSGGVISVAQRFNVNIFPIDPAGIRAPVVPTAPKIDPTDPRAIPSSYDSQTAINNTERLNTLRMNLAGVAAMTGGQMFQFNEFSKSINQVFQETGSFYLLGYVSTNTTPDDKWRDLQVKVNRKGLTVRARNKTEPQASARANRPVLPSSPSVEALAGLVPVRDVPLSLSVVSFMSEASAGKVSSAAVTVTLGLPAPSEGADDLDVTLKAFTFDGTLKDTKTFRAHVPAAASIKPGQQVQVIQRMDLPTGRYQMRVGVTSAQRKASGSVYADFDVPDFARDAVSMSGVALSDAQQRSVVAEGAFSRLPEVLPMTSRQFAGDAKIVGLVELYQAGAGEPKPVPVWLTIKNDRQQSVSQQSSTIDPAQFAGGHGAQFRFELPLSKLAPGEYLLTVETASEKTKIQRNVRFVVK